MAVAGLVSLIAPVVIILIVPFSGGDYLSLPPPSLSVRWYERVIGVPGCRPAVIVSAQVAALTTKFARDLGLLASLALASGQFRWKDAVYAFPLCLGETSIITANGCEPVTHASRQLVVN